MTIRLCISCNSIIPSVRISVNPSANRCIKCQTNFEKTHDIKMKIYDVKKAIDVVKPETKNRKTKPAAIAQQTVVCPHCGANVIYLAKHIRKMHAEHKTIEIADSSFRSCSCAGSNENCIQCRDIDFYNPENLNKESTYIFSSKPVTSSKNLAKNKKHQVALKYSCEVCQKIFETNNLLSLHRKDKHTYSIIISDSVADNLSMKKKIAANTRAMVIAAKTARVHEKVLGNRKFICPTCRKRFKDANDVLMHMKAMHALEPEYLRISQNQKRHPAKLSSSPQTYKQTPTHHQIPTPIKPQRESKFDGSRDYYNNYRENGKLGSHASHDAYGDEDFA